jgi:hypothetical protein
MHAIEGTYINSLLVTLNAWVRSPNISEIPPLIEIDFHLEHISINLHSSE